MGAFANIVRATYLPSTLGETDFFLFSPRSFFRNRLLFRLFIGQSPGKRGTRRQKSTAHAAACEGGGSRLEMGGSAGASARIWLQFG